jgi:hypothetical protein
MGDSASALLKAVQTLLKADEAMSALVEGRVYGAAPGNAIYPYVVVSCTSQPWQTQSFFGMRHLLRVQGFSQDGKPGVLLAIREATFNALNRNDELSVDGFTLVDIQHDGIASCFPEGDGTTYQSVIEFSCYIQ